MMLISFLFLLLLFWLLHFDTTTLIGRQIQHQHQQQQDEIDEDHQFVACTMGRLFAFSLLMAMNRLSQQL